MKQLSNKIFMAIGIYLAFHVIRIYRSLFKDMDFVMRKPQFKNLYREEEAAI